MEYAWGSLPVVSLHDLKTIYWRRFWELKNVVRLTTTRTSDQPDTIERALVVNRRKAVNLVQVTGVLVAGSNFFPVTMGLMIYWRYVGLGWVQRGHSHPCWKAILQVSPNIMSLIWTPSQLWKCLVEFIVWQREWQCLTVADILFRPRSAPCPTARFPAIRIQVDRSGDGHFRRRYWANFWAFFQPTKPVG